MTQRVDFGAFSFDAPDKWTLSSVFLSGPVEEAPTQGMLTTKAVPPFQRNLITTMEAVSPQETVESFVKKQSDALAAAKVARQEVAPPELVTLADGQVRGLLTEQVISGPRGEKVRQMQLVFIKGNVAYTAIASHLDGTAFEGARAEFRSMLLSYR